MSDITFFTVNALDNGYFEDKLPSNDFLKLCLYSWVKEYNVVVYDYKHPIVKESVDYLKNVYGDDFCKINPSHISDFIRLKILSEYTQHFYFDVDTYLNSKIILDDLESFQIRGSSFCSMYNGNDLQTAKDMLSVYFEDKTNIRYMDNEILIKSGYINKIKRMNSLNIIHFAGIDDNSICVVINPSEKTIAENYLKLRKYGTANKMKIIVDSEKRKAEIKEIIKYYKQNIVIWNIERMKPKARQFLFNYLEEKTN